MQTNVVSCRVDNKKGQMWGHFHQMHQAVPCCVFLFFLFLAAYFNIDSSFTFFFLHFQQMSLHLQTKAIASINKEHTRTHTVETALDCVVYV